MPRIETWLQMEAPHFGGFSTFLQCLHIPMGLLDRTCVLWDTPPWISKTMSDIPKSSREQKAQGSSPDHLLHHVALHCPSPCLCHLQKTFQRPETMKTMAKGKYNKCASTYLLYLLLVLFSSLPNSKATLKRCYSIENIASDMIRF